MPTTHADVLVIGAGIAGASVAAHLAESRSVILVEGEERPGYHSTGRSAALFTEIYGNPTIRALTRASRAFLFDPPTDFTDRPLTRPRGCLYIATAAQLTAMSEFHALPDIAPATRTLDVREALELCPILRRDYVAGALLEPDCADIDVHALHQGYLRLFKKRDGRLITNSPVHSLVRAHDGWRMQAGTEHLTASLIVNAAGAWADQLAAQAGVPQVGLTPCRRTAMLVDPPPDMAIGGWPFVNDIDEKFYFKPEAGSLFLSPADETPSEPTDAQPEEWDTAAAVDRMEQATTLQIRRLKARWAGLRTFAPDRTPVVGYSSAEPTFFWLAGQGGYGLQTAPALSRAAAALVLGSALPSDLAAQGLEAAAMSPQRFLP
ncbi:MAG: FAD-dependent oxidoreductase [Steroidobacteraceae bacterium]|jgi:D-arginine dehydrogenase